MRWSGQKYLFYAITDKQILKILIENHKRGQRQQNQININNAHAYIM